MKKRIITAASFAACLALCAAVWLQNKPAGETPALPTPPTVNATQPEAPEIPEIEEIIMPEEEKDEIAQPEPIHEVTIEPEPNPTSIQTPPVSEIQATPEWNATPPQEPEPIPASPDSAPDNMIYVPGFGWIESRRPQPCRIR